MRAAKNEAHLLWRLPDELLKRSTKQKHSSMLKKCWGSVTAAGYGSLFAFINMLLNIHNQQFSATW
jgi:hypothetical protein